jgi:hypothetical protein
MNRTRLVLVGIATILVGYGAASVLLGDFPWNIVRRLVEGPALTGENTQQRASWIEHGIHNYQVAVEDRGYNTICSALVQRFELSVNEGTVSNAAVYSDILQYCPNVLSDLTVDGVFNIAEKFLANWDPIRDVIEIEYDPQYNFIRYLSVDQRPTFMDMFKTRTFHDFKITVVEFNTTQD